MDFKKARHSTVSSHVFRPEYFPNQIGWPDNLFWMADILFKSSRHTVSCHMLIHSYCNRQSSAAIAHCKWYRYKHVIRSSGSCRRWSRTNIKATACTKTAISVVKLFNWLGLFKWLLAEVSSNNNYQKFCISNPQVILITFFCCWWNATCHECRGKTN